MRSSVNMFKGHKWAYNKENLKKTSKTSRIDGAPIPSPSTPSSSFHELVGLTSNPNPSLDFTLDFTSFESDDEKSMKNAKMLQN
jgi:hypothetical protein